MNSRNRFKVEEIGGDYCDFESGAFINDAFTPLDPNEYSEDQRALVDEFNRRAETGNQRYRIAMYRAEMFEKGFNAGMYICTFDLEENMTSFVFTDETRRLLGYDGLDDLPNTFDSWVKTLLPEQRDVMVTVFWNTVKAHRQLPDISHAEYPMMRKDGRIIWVTGAGRFIRREDGSLEIYMGCYRDVTAEHEKDDYLHIIEGIGRVFNFSLYIDMSNETYRIISTNEYVEKVRKDANAFKFLRDNVDSSVHEDYKEELKAWLQPECIVKLLKEKETISKDFYSAEADRWFRGIFMVGDKNSDGSPAHIIYGCQDITDEKRCALRCKAELEKAVEDENALLKEITALNTQLNENQARLEEASAEQEAQLEETQALNRKLLESKDKISEAYGMIEGLSSEYHTIWLVNKETSKMRLIRSSGKSTIKRAVQMGIDEPAFDPAFDNYIASCVEPEDRERMHREIAFAEVLRRLAEQPDELYAVNYLRRDDSGRVGYHQIAFANADTQDGKKQFVYGFRDIDKIFKEEQKQKEELREALNLAQEAAAEQEAQLEEINALNDQLQKNQAVLEASYSEQEAQLEEIKALNESLVAETTAKEKEHAIVDALSASYLNVYVINTAEQTVEILKLNGYVTRGLSKEKTGPYPYEATCRAYISSRVYCHDQDMVAKYMSLENLLLQLKDKKEYEFTYRVPENGGVSYYQGKYVMVDGGYIVCGFQNIDEIVKKEKEQKEELKDAYDQLAKNAEEREEQYRVIGAISADYTNVFLIDTAKDTSKAIALREDVGKLISIDSQAEHNYTEAVGRYISSSRVHPEDVAFLSENMQLSHIVDELKNKVEFSENFRIIENGTIHYYRFKYRTVPGTKYVILGIQNTDKQVSDEIRRNNELRNHIKEITELNHSLNDYNRIMSSAGYGMWHIILKDGDAPRMQANGKMAELLGVSGQSRTEEEMYHAWYDRIVPEAIPSVQASVDEMMRGSFSENTYQWVHPVKGKIYVRCGGTAMKLDDGTNLLSGYHAEVTDIVREEQRHNAELERAKEEAEAASKAKTSFLFNMSHDIRTPMNAIMGFRDLLEKYQDDPVKRRDYLNKIQDASTVLLSIINNVLEMARIEKGTLEIDETAWSAEQFYDTLYSVFHVMMESKGLTFTKQIEVQHHYVYCDPTKLREIFINILSNAYKYTNAGGSVRMLLEEIPYDRKGWTLYRTTISDTGIGMSEEFLPHIFEEFSREKNTTDAKVEGTGLGMPIVKRLVDMLGGTIEVRSKKGEGSTFIVTIPHKITEKSGLVQRARVEIDPELFKGKRILLAEDNDLNAEIAEEILSEAGFIVERAEDGSICVDMLESAESGYYDLILMDIQMPNMNGYEAAKAIRHLQDSDKAGISIIAMTANAFEEDKREAIRAGMDGHLAKPINVSELMRTLAGALR